MNASLCPSWLLANQSHSGYKEGYEIACEDEIYQKLVAFQVLIPHLKMNYRSVQKLALPVILKSREIILSIDGSMKQNLTIP